MRNTLQSVGLGLVLSAAMALTAQAETIERTNVYPWESSVGYSQIVEVGGLVFLSGVISQGPDFAAQVKAVYGGIRDQLSEHGLSMDNVVKETVFTTDMEGLKAANSIRKSYFSENAFPSSTWVQVERLFFPENLIEVEIIAARP